MFTTAEENKQATSSLHGIQYYNKEYYHNTMQLFVGNGYKIYSSCNGGNEHS